MTIHAFDLFILSDFRVDGKRVVMLAKFRFINAQIFHELCQCIDTIQTFILQMKCAKQFSVYLFRFSHRFQC